MKRTEAEAIVQAGALGNVDQLQEYLQQGFDIVNSADKVGRTALMHAALHGQLDAARFLLGHGSNPNMQDKTGYTALHYAAQDYMPEMVALLVSKGATIDISDEHGNTALFKAVFGSNGRGEIIKLLLIAGADPGHKNNYGVSPLELAQSIANYPVLQFFEPT